MLESLRNQLNEAEDMGATALVSLRNGADQIEHWADDGIEFLRGSKPGPLMIGVAAVTAGAAALYALYSLWRSAPAKTRKVVAARARKQAGKVSRKIAKTATHRAAAKLPGANGIAKTGAHRAMEKMAGAKIH